MPRQQFCGAKINIEFSHHNFQIQAEFRGEFKIQSKFSRLYTSIKLLRSYTSTCRMSSRKRKVKEIGGNRSMDENTKSVKMMEESNHFCLADLPHGFRFLPTDEELIRYYVINKVLDKPLPLNKFIDVNIYNYNPDQLAGSSSISLLFFHLSFFVFVFAASVPTLPFSSF